MQTLTDQQSHSRPAGTDVGFDAVVADADRVNGESMSWCLKAYGGFRNVTALGSGAELMTAIRSQRPRVIVVGERLIVHSMREIFGELAVRLGETRVVAFATRLTDRQLDLLVNNRVSGLLSRQDSMRTISDQLLQVCSGQTVLSDVLQSRIQQQHDGSFRCLSSGQLQKLTDRQWDVLLRIAEGSRVSDVARALSISEKAVESHKYRIMRAIGASDRVDLCRWAIREGLIEA